MSKGFDTTHSSAGNKIVQDIYFKVACGKYKKGEKLPSVREMAAKWSVSPDTVQRAYSQLEQVSLIVPAHGLGTFVTDDEKWIEHFRSSLMVQKTDTFLREMKEMGVTIPEIISLLDSKNSEESGRLRIETAEDAEKFLEDFEKYAAPDENGNYSITFRNNIDHLYEKVWTTLFKSDGKWYFQSRGETWAPLRAKEMIKIVPFVLKYAEAILELISEQQPEEETTPDVF